MNRCIFSKKIASLTCTFCKPGNVAIAPCKLLKLIPWRLSVVVCATGWFIWFWLFPVSIVVPGVKFAFRVNWKVEFVFVEDKSLCCWCGGLDNGDVDGFTLFFGEDMKCAEHEPVDNGDELRPALNGLCEIGFLMFFVLGFMCVFFVGVFGSNRKSSKMRLISDLVRQFPTIIFKFRINLQWNF